MPVKGSYLLLGGIGGIFLWSAIRGKKVTDVVKKLIGGQDPKQAGNITPLDTYVTQTGATNTPGLKAPVVVGASEKAWITALLLGIGAPPTAANMDSVSRWIVHESSWDNNPPDGALYTKNPLNTTQPGFAEVGNVNSVGVKIYATLGDGLAATVTVLNNGLYNDILAALRSGKGLQGNYQGLSTWSGGGYSSV